MRLLKRISRTLLRVFFGKTIKAIFWQSAVHRQWASYGHDVDGFFASQEDVRLYCGRTVYTDLALHSSYVSIPTSTHES